MISTFSTEESDESQIVAAEQETKRCYATIMLPLASIVAPSRIVLRFQANLLVSALNSLALSSPLLSCSHSSFLDPPVLDPPVGSRLLSQ